MNGFLDADDRQAALHGYRQITSHLSLFLEACDDLSIPERIRDPMVDTLFQYMLETLRVSEQQQAIAGMFEGLSEQMRKLSDEDDA